MKVEVTSQKQCRQCQIPMPIPWHHYEYKLRHGNATPSGGCTLRSARFYRKKEETP